MLKIKLIAIAAITLFMITGCDQTTPDTYQDLHEPTMIYGAIVDYVIDGDTVNFYDIGKVRLQGIDTPETSAYYEIEGQTYENQRMFDQANACAGGDTNTIMQMGEYSKNYTINMLSNDYYFDIVDKGTDYYGRLLGEVLVPVYGSLNKNLVRDGYAYPFMDNDNLYSEDVQFARTNGNGLWSLFPDEMECLYNYYK